MRADAGVSDKPKGKERAPLSVVQAAARPARDELEAFLIGWQLRKPEWVGGQIANALFRELRSNFNYSSALLDVCQQTIDAAADGGLPITPQHVAAKIAAENPTVQENDLFEFLRSWSLAAPASGSENNLRREMSSTLDLLRDGSRADLRREANELLLSKGIDALPEVQQMLDQGAERSGLLSSADFVAGYRPLDYLWDGILQRGFLYNLTGQTGAGKTAFALRFMAHVAEGKQFGGRDVEQGRVLMLAGENPDDVRMRWIALAEQASFVASDIPVSFRPGLVSIRSELPTLKAQARAAGGFALIVVDTENAFFTCDFEDENDNRQRGEWARVLRELTTLAGKPTVLALGHPIKGATDNLFPRGGGAYLGEIDGNLTASAENGAGRIHTQGKFRGPEFEAIPFELVTVTSPQLVTAKDRSMPTVIARPLSDSEHEQRIEAANTDQQQLLKAMLDNEGASMKELAVALGWRMKSGDPYKAKVQRVLGKLVDQKLARKAAGVSSLTPSGEKAAKRVSK